MLELDSPRWSELAHAYGPASDIPALLRQLDSLPATRERDEPWYTLWSALAHQGDVYPASFAAVPHVVAALATAPERADSSYFHFPAWVDVCRFRKNVEIPADLRAAYVEALAKLPGLVAAASSREWSEEFLACALAAIAAAKGYPAVAEAAQELTPRVADAFVEWFYENWAG
ncbi:hypothetical protein FHW12_003170 [Dokdonella fugitiva]|uniref:Uncharacterized protein n=1 Tax=Dokdonella fugitiva TaxID=328517 RepID=A0A839F9Y6_9GAMM|nr:hypothetical protein [Dokdonella fugitiva]MBA8888934.1 hypothetical protein [Dokdonella fugitiva]